MLGIAAALGGFAVAAGAPAAVTPPAGYIYSAELLGNLTDSCIAAGPGGTFVGIGPGFGANVNAVVLAKESGELRLVAMGFNSIGGCAYDAAADVLYVTDNAKNGDYGLTGAQSGDNVFAIPSASTASGLSAPGLEMLPPNSIPFAASVALDSSGNVFVANPVGNGTGTVLKIVGGLASTFVSGLDLASGLAFNSANGNLFVGDAHENPDFTTINSLKQFTAMGAAVPPVPFAGPSNGFGSFGLALNSDGRLLVSGVFGGDVVSFDTSNATSTTFVSGLTDAGGMTVDAFTHRVEILSSTFTGADEDKSLHRFTPIDRLVAGGTSPKTDCLQEFYGLPVGGSGTVCTDGDPCDADGKKNDSCLFPVGFCFNVSDPNLSECTSGNITAVSITAKPASAAIAHTASAIAGALPIAASTCSFSDGVTVPVQIAASGKKAGNAKLKVQTTTDDGRKDTDVVKLVCQPAP
jgi:hypothetical protein